MLVTMFLILLFQVSKPFGSKNSSHLLEEIEPEYLKILRKGNVSSYVFFQRNRPVEKILNGILFMLLLIFDYIIREKIDYHYSLFCIL